MRHVFACLVHERAECVVDLIRNLQFFEPGSAVMLYDGSARSLSEHTSTFEALGATVCQAPRRQTWGRLHESVFDCLELGRERFGFDAMTFVDSDQLLAGRGYAAAVRTTLEREPGIGVIGTPNPSLGEPWVTVSERREQEIWRPFLDRYPHGLEQQFPAHWIFWPGTVITGDAAAALSELRTDPVFRALLAQSHFASEEIAFSTAAAALGFKVVPKPWRDIIRWRRPIRVAEAEDALADPDCFWLHPVPRDLEHASRAFVRQMSNEYEGFTPTLSPPVVRKPALTRLKRGTANGFFRLLTKPVDGLAAKEARSAVARARRAQT
jgi:hypothetical protein